MIESNIVTREYHSALCIIVAFQFSNIYFGNNEQNTWNRVKQSHWREGGGSGVAYTNTDKMHSSSRPLKFLSTSGHDVVQNFHPAAPKLSGAGCVCLCFCSSPASCSSVVSTRPPSSHQTQGTQPCCHSAQAPQRLRFPLGLTEVFAVSHIVGIQHQPVYWSPCGFSLSLSLLPLSFFLSFFLFFFLP